MAPSWFENFPCQLKSVGLSWSQWDSVGISGTQLESVRVSWSRWESNLHPSQGQWLKIAAQSPLTIRLRWAASGAEQDFWSSWVTLVMNYHQACLWCSLNPWKCPLWHHWISTLIFPSSTSKRRKNVEVKYVKHTCFQNKNTIAISFACYGAFHESEEWLMRN